MPGVTRVTVTKNLLGDQRGENTKLKKKKEKKTEKKRNKNRTRGAIPSYNSLTYVKKSNNSLDLNAKL